ncbi:type I-E CRISPR-associated protein Cse1/CasA [Azospirillum sp. A1-3]|uniref:type I-E CRISPR-associated protein Cse1/CasA n=1 Tax=Azospirillum sp. A1-3 TaxID=185874 RepID=UPI002077159D|nr:type I-E CRISPR-associated protein Cse1/CasA [Azospirillum sp. A1-3]MCM8738626.1 type I-E CRISPR-associated protein Cse1/CasA [Azospirillum sp. A1-3]
MSSATLSFFRQAVPVVRQRSGPGLATPLTLTDGHLSDPIVAVRLGHPLVERGFEFLMRDILQAALPPRSVSDWEQLLAAPPTPVQLTEALAPYEDAFQIDHPSHPALQVRPSPQRLAEAAGRKPPKARRPAEEAEDDDEDAAGLQPIATLLPDAPTAEAVKQDADFFVRRGGVTAIGAGAVLPVLYAHMVLFPPGGGGYLGLPHGADSIKFQMVGATLWETLWLNVLTRHADGMETALWPAPLDATVFPWLDGSLAGMPLGRKDEQASRSMERRRLHPAHIPMPRRYLLAPPVPGRCDLTGLEGPVFTGYSRWPKGLAYQPTGWWMPWASRIVSAGKSDEPSQFLRARGPLRFDDWLETALLTDQPATSASRPAKQRLLPPVLRQFQSAGSPRPAGPSRRTRAERSATALMEEDSLRVRACAQFFYNKPVGGMSQRELPVFDLPAADLGWLGDQMSRALDRLGRMAGALHMTARSACRVGRREGPAALADHLKDRLLAALDGAVLDGAGRLAGLARDHTGEERVAAAEAVAQELLVQGQDAAVRLFDTAFPIAGTTATDRLLAMERAVLIGRLTLILSPKTTPKETP